MKTFWIVLLLFLQASLFSYWWFLSPSGGIKLAKSREKTKVLEGECLETKNELDRLKRLLQAWEEDPYLLEKYARENLGMSRSGEFVVVLDK